MTTVKTEIGARDKAYQTIFSPNGQIIETDVQRAIEAVMAYAVAIAAGLPTSSVDNTVPRFSGTAGAFEDTAVTIDDNNFIGTLPGIGIGGATADVVNRLSANTPAVLFNRETDDIQVKLNKNAVGDTASFVFQTGFSGRAEIGLVGDDDFQFKVSPDGSTFFSGIILDKDDGTVRIPLGSTLGGVATFTGTVDAGGATSLELPNSATPTVNADGEIALDTTVADFSHGLLRLFGGEEQFVISLPVAALAAPNDGDTLVYNATNDEFELGAGGGGGATTALDNLAAVAINTTLLPGLNDGAGLGSGTLAFSDLFLASGGTLNFNNSDVVITHSTDLLAVTGASVVVGHSALVSTQVENTAITPSLQNIGTNPSTGSILSARYSADGGPAYIALAKSRNATPGAHTVVLDTEAIGVISFAGSDGTNFAEAARIAATINGTPGAGDMPGRLSFRVSPDGTEVPVEGLGLSNSGLEIGHATDTTLARSSAGNLSIEGRVIRTAGKESIWIPAAAWFPLTAPATAFVFDVSAALPMMNFDPTTEEYALTTIGMPKSWDEGTISFQVYWNHPAATTNFNVVWGIFAQAFSNDDPLTDSPNTVTVTDTGGTTGDMYISPESSALTIAGSPAEGDLVRLAFYRDADNGSDNLAVDARLIGVMIFYTTNATNDT